MERKLIYAFRGWIGFVAFMDFGTAGRSYIEKRSFLSKTISDVEYVDEEYTTSRIIGIFSILKALVLIHCTLYIHYKPVVSFYAPFANIITILLKIAHFSNEDKYDMINCFTECEENANLASELYFDIYPETVQRYKKIFKRLKQNLQRFGLFTKQQPKTYYKPHREHAANVVSQHVRENPNASSRDIQNNLGIQKNNSHTVVSMGICSLIISIVLYFTETIYFRAATVNFYVVFPCILNAVTLAGLLYIPQSLKLWDTQLEDDENIQLFKQTGTAKRRRTFRKNM